MPVVAPTKAPGFAGRLQGTKRVRPIRLCLWLTALMLVGCSGDDLGPSAQDYQPDGISAYGARSDVALPPRMSVDSDGSDRLAAHMDKQDPRWSDREWREQRRAERFENARWERELKRRAEVHRQKRAAALEANGGY